MSSARPLVFISYAHLDEPDNPGPGEVRWLSFVMDFLRPGVKGHKYEVWIDRLMPGGADWSPEIEARVRACDVFVLLVSTHSTGSDYILDKEVPIVRERQKKGGDSVWFYPLLIDWTPRAGLEQVADKNLRPREAKPFSSLSPSERSRQMAEAADEIADVAKEIADKKAEAASQQALIAKLAERAKVGMLFAQGALGVGKSIILDDLASKPAVVAIGGLPETGYERLVGRDADLKCLDGAWSDDRTNILSLVAEGGAGKSALVNEWLSRVQTDGYRGADCVLGWSFYSQGSKERATSADEFLNWAVRKLCVTAKTNNASAKGEAIAEALTERRALLVLDGVEPLQHGPGMQAGQLKDQGLRALLRRYAAAPPRANHSLIVLTSRIAVADIQRFKNTSAPVVDVERLSDEAGAELLRASAVWGIDSELLQAAHDFGGHPLALTLLASLLKETQNGDVRRRDHIRGLLADADDPRHDHARRVMESYEHEWLEAQPVLLAILKLVGLFDRPADGTCLKALRAKPAIHGLTSEVVGLSREQWQRAIARLREVRLLSPINQSDPESLDTHPLVREWFGERLRVTNEAAWKAAHTRLYYFLCNKTREGAAPTLADLAPLYHAIAHGCRAGWQQKTLNEVYKDRICRRLTNGVIEFYSSRRLGAQGSNLAAISWFFDRPYETPTAALAPSDRAWVLSEASFGLRAQGRLQEALSALWVGLQMEEKGLDWRNAAITSSNISQTELLLGGIDTALATANKAVVLADTARIPFQKIVNQTTLADALHHVGEREKAEELFVEAERRHRESHLDYPMLYGFQGYTYCDLLLSQGQAAAARDRATRTLEWVRPQKLVLEVALDTLMLVAHVIAFAGII